MADGRQPRRLLPRRVRPGRGRAAARPGAPPCRDPAHDDRLRGRPAPAGARVRALRRRAARRQRALPERRAPPDPLRREPRAGAALADGLSVGVWFWETRRLPGLPPARAEVRRRGLGRERVRRRGDPGRDGGARRSSSRFPWSPRRQADGEPRRPRPADDRFLFSFVFDFHSTVARKNPGGLIDAYSRAFGPDDGAIARREEHQRRQLPRRPAARSRQRPRAGRTSASSTASCRPSRLPRYTALADCSVSLHRSEGFGLTLAEAMALGKPVDRDRLLGQPDVHGRRELLPRAPPADGARRGRRAVPGGLDLGRARPRSRGRADAARRPTSPTRRGSEPSAGARRSSRITRSNEPPRSCPSTCRSSTAAGSGGAVRATPSERAAGFLSTARRRAGRRRRGSAGSGRLYRRLLVRLIRPYTARQREFEHAVVDGLRELELENDGAAAAARRARASARGT